MRYGAFSCALEEWTEAALLIEWVDKRRVMARGDMRIPNTTEYIGALSDFTGEIGRLAIAFASARNLSAVNEVLETDLVVSSMIAQFNINNKYSKKADAVAMNLKKVEDIVYDMSLVGRGGKVREKDSLEEERERPRTVDNVDES